MNRRNRIVAIAAWGIASTFPAHAQMAADLAGTWELMSVVNTASDGTKSRPYGDRSVGTLIADRNGRFALLLIDPNVPKFASNNRVGGTPEENAAAVRGSLGYFGTYLVADKVATLRVEGSTYPNWTSASLKFSIVSFNGDTLKWAVAAAIGGQTETEWRRLK